ncbi:hypothetical protein [Emticicia sp. 17c]|uniref:hypothetical protein n=1 Tax=Emticicia sp. 17c TaxID=3127704 RepID=UPI00301C47B1
MSVFDNLKKISQLFGGLNKEMARNIAKQAARFAIRKVAEQHSGKQYRGQLINTDGVVECEVIIIPKSDYYIAGMGEIIKDRLELSVGKAKLDIELLPEA